MSPFSRRTLLGGLAAAPLSGSLASARPAGGPATPAAIAQMKLGRVTVSFLSDGVLDAPAEWFTGEQPDAMRRRIAGRLGGDGRSLRLNFTAWLVDDGERLVLLDAGSGGAAGPSSGRLPTALQSLGIAPRDVSIAAATHTHFDHIGGFLTGERAAFPEAELLLPRADVALFTDPARRNAAPDFLRGSFDLTARLVAAAPRLQRIEGERAITPFVSTLDLAGHTPGHTGFRISDAGQTLWLVGDALFDPALHPARDDLGIVFETDPAAARAMRARLFARAEEEGALLSATHLPFPGLGRIVREGGQRVWRAADFPQAG